MRSAGQAVLTALLILKENVTDKTVRRAYLWCECVLAHLPSSSQVVIPVVGSGGYRAAASFCTGSAGLKKPDFVFR